MKKEIQMKWERCVSMYVFLHVWKRETERQIDNKIKWKNKRQRDTETERQRDRETGRQGDRKTPSQRHGDKDTEIQKKRWKEDRETEIY